MTDIILVVWFLIIFDAFSPMEGTGNAYGYREHYPPVHQEQGRLVDFVSCSLMFPACRILT